MVIIILLQIDSALNIFYNNLIFLILQKMFHSMITRRMEIWQMNINFIIMKQSLLILLIILRLYHFSIIMLITLKIVVFLQMNSFISYLYINVLIFNHLFCLKCILLNLKNYIQYHQMKFISNLE